MGCDPVVYFAFATCSFTSATLVNWTSLAEAGDKEEPITKSFDRVEKAFHGLRHTDLGIPRLKEEQIHVFI